MLKLAEDEIANPDSSYNTFEVAGPDLPQYRRVHPQMVHACSLPNYRL